VKTARRELVDRSLNVFLRLAATGSRFLLLLTLARFLPPADVGRYGIVLSTVLLGVSFLGAEFHAYSTRELLREGPARWSFVLQHSLVAWLFAYALLGPILLVSSGWWSLAGIAILWLPLLMMVEHLCQETNRILIAMQRPLLASVWMFVRMGAWVWILLPTLWLQPSLRRLDVVFLAWFVGAAISLLASATFIARLARPWQAWQLDWRWLIRGVTIGALYFVSSLAYRGLFTVDRYAVLALNGPDQLGVYVLFIGLATAMITVIEPAILSFLTPRLVAAWQAGDRVGYAKIYRELRSSVLLLSTSIAVAILLAAPWLVVWIGKPAYVGQQPLLWSLLAMVWISANGLPLDGALYARGRDRDLMVSMLLAVLGFGVALAAWSRLETRFAVPGALAVAFLANYAAKRYFLARANRAEAAT
jgi:O-antigen/teichoic acid export membrane protein